ncbi:MAG: nuclear transport factor 2 family protein [Verrucomicrobia bacterium]|nr:nuclear transport factor 2 family protein [Verrucomicrobiota bacterium]
MTKRLLVCLTSAALSLLMLAACRPSVAAHSDEAAIRAFLDRYFDTWSHRDMDGYGACFDSQARIHFMARNGEITSRDLADFLHGQKLFHEQSEAPATERPLEIRIQGDSKAAQATVTWVLTTGKKEERGADFFTLRRGPDGWKIVNLLFYVDGP